MVYGEQEFYQGFYHGSYISYVIYADQDYNFEKLHSCTYDVADG